MISYSGLIHRDELRTTRFFLRACTALVFQMSLDRLPSSLRIYFCCHLSIGIIIGIPCGSHLQDIFHKATLLKGVEGGDE